MAHLVFSPRYLVRCWDSWADVGAYRYASEESFESAEAAFAFARASGCPLIDVLESGKGVVASRERLRHPKASPGQPWEPTDSIPAATGR